MGFMKRETVESIDYKGYKINIYQDEDAMDPNWLGNSDMMLTYGHRDFCTEPKGFEARDVYDCWARGDKFYYYLRNGYKKKDGTMTPNESEYWFMFPVYSLIHSGVSLSLAKQDLLNYDPGGWDTSFMGFALVRRIKGWAWRKDKAYEKAQLIVETWNQYLSGDVYGYMIGVPDDDDPEEFDEVGGCWGFYGDEGIKQIISEAKPEIDSMIERETDRNLTEVNSLNPIEVV